MLVVSHKINHALLVVQDVLHILLVTLIQLNQFVRLQILLRYLLDAVGITLQLSADKEYVQIILLLQLMQIVIHS